MAVKGKGKVGSWAGKTSTRGVSRGTGANLVGRGAPKKYKESMKFQLVVNSRGLSKRLGGKPKKTKFKTGGGF